MIRDVDEQIRVLSRGCEHIYSEDELRKRIERAIETGQPMRAKLGMDPTAPDLTLGHTVVLGKLRDFQDMGHKAVLIIGDYTARIGDPTGKSKTRPVLSEADVDANAKTYLDQAGKVIDLSPEKLEIRRNSEWLAPMTFADVIRLAGQTTVARMMERDTFANRQAAGVEIHLHELFYPMMQAHDSVCINADVELGGNDQTFNNLLGREFQRNASQRPQIVVIMPLLVGIDGHEKMSKSLGNYIAVTDAPSDMFGKTMSIPDTLMRNYFELLTRMPDGEIGSLVDGGSTHPRDAKVALAKAVVARFYDAATADSAAEEFARIHRAGQGGLPDDIPELPVSSKVGAIELTRQAGFAASNGEARRLIAEKGVRLNGEPLLDANAEIVVHSGDILQRGKRRFVKLITPE